MDALLTVVVVTYNNRHQIGPCLSSLQAAARLAPDLAMRICVADNASPDGTADLVRHSFPDVDLFVLERNAGFGAANNKVLREVASPYVLLLNPDTEVVGDAPAALVRFLEGRPEAGIVGGRLVYPDGRFQHSAFAFPNLAMSLLDFFPINHRLTESRINGRYPRSQYERPFEIDHPLGACMCVRKDVLDLIGGFDERFFMYCEEIDLCLRAKRAGWQVWYTPDATIVHHEAASTRQFRGPMLVELHRSRFRFFAKHYSESFVAIARMLVRVGVTRDLVRAARDRLAGSIGPEEWNVRRSTYTRVLAL